MTSRMEVNDEPTYGGLYVPHHQNSFSLALHIASQYNQDSRQARQRSRLQQEISQYFWQDFQASPCWR